jgi:hypothetical protein
MPRRSSLAPLPSRPDADLRGVWRAGEIEAAAALLIANECGLFRGHLIDVHPSQSITVLLGLGVEAAAEVAPTFDRQAKPRTGWSSIPFGATPVCPCL